MRILLIGGPRFLGYHVLEAALARSHEVTTLNRGKSDAGLFPEVEKLHGDRDGGLDALGAGSWDAVIDTCGYAPRVVRQSCAALAGRASHYQFVSSISVLADQAAVNQDEEAPVGVLLDPQVEEVTGETYGPLKAACEDVVRDGFDGDALVVRPGLIVGPRDPTDRFTYWPVRVARGGEVLAPEGPQATTQVIDVRDLAEWMIRSAEARLTGTFHATGPEVPVRFGDLVEACREASGSDASSTWLPAEFLAEQRVAPWQDLPAWVPAEARGFVTVSVARAITAGLTFRPLVETARDTLSWWRAERDDGLRCGLSPEREAEVLAAWHARGATPAERAD